MRSSFQIYSTNRISLFAHPLRTIIAALLLVNLMVFISNEMVVRTMDAIAWLVILIWIEWKDKKDLTSTDHAIQWIALGFISLSCSMSFIQHDWVSLANEITWLMVLLLSPTLYERYRYFKPLLYLSLVGYATYWGITSSLLDCYDAFLWIGAFLQLEYEQKFIAQEPAYIS